MKIKGMYLLYPTLKYILFSHSQILIWFFLKFLLKSPQKYLLPSKLILSDL
jgi:hypothetical protein